MMKGSGRVLSVLTKCVGVDLPVRREHDCGGNVRSCAHGDGEEG
jgi:hypothetical protein